MKYEYIILTFTLLLSGCGVFGVTERKYDCKLNYSAPSVLSDSGVYLNELTNCEEYKAFIDSTSDCTQLALVTKMTIELVSNQMEAEEKCEAKEPSINLIYGSGISFLGCTCVENR